MLNNNELQFVGRKQELQILERFAEKKSASLIVIRGRRRIGKSRLVEEFARDKTFYSFSGLFPTKKTTLQTQLDEFARQLSTQTGLPEVQVDDWSKLFLLLTEKIKSDQAIVLFDEISWMGSKDPDFLGKIKNAWDMHFKKNPNLIFIICGSASSWIEKNILSSTGFVGRISFVLTLRELPLRDCNYFWGKYTNNISAYEKLKILAVFGGVPKYLEEINSKLSAEDNIKNICFSEGGLLVNEFENIFSTSFMHNTIIYKQIVNALISGSKNAKTICENLNIQQDGSISEYLEELELAGFIKRDHTWHIKTGKDQVLSKYRLSDNYIRFYLKYIEPYLTKISRDSFTIKTLTALPEWDSIMALQFENLVINNKRYIHEALGIRAEDIISENPFFQTANTKQPGCQIDYMIQTKFNTLYICEIKFSKNSIGLNIINEITDKISRLKYPKRFSIRAVLIHINGITDELLDSDFFAGIINFSEFVG